MRHDPINEASGTASRSQEGYLARPGSGSGPGLVVLHDPAAGRAVADLFAEEGYTALVPEPNPLSLPGDDAALGAVTAAAEALRSQRECGGKVGILGFGRGADLALRAVLSGVADCAVAYDPTGSGALLDGPAQRGGPAVAHSPEHGGLAAVRQALAALDIELHTYPGARAGFATPGSDAFDKSASLMAHTRTLGLLRRVMGPHYDLEALWEQHTALEFAARDAEATMATMVAEPYVNHIPTMTGGVGYTELLRFYKHHFIPTTPPDARLVPVSRTVGVDRLVDEFVFTFTHDREVDWLLPGVPPTHRLIEIPMLAVVRFRGDKLYNEHIYWDQATVLVQAGLLDPGLLPVAGVETARKLLDESLPSNALMRRWSESAPKAVA